MHSIFARTPNQSAGMHFGCLTGFASWRFNSSIRRHISFLVLFCVCTLSSPELRQEFIFVSRAGTHTHDHGAHCIARRVQQHPAEYVEYYLHLLYVDYTRKLMAHSTKLKLLSFGRCNKFTYKLIRTSRERQMCATECVCVCAALFGCGVCMHAVGKCRREMRRTCHGPYFIEIWCIIFYVRQQIKEMSAIKPFLFMRCVLDTCDGIPYLECDVCVCAHCVRRANPHERVYKKWKKKSNS